MRVVDQAMRQLQQKEFLAQVGYGRVAVNHQKVWVFDRDRASEGIAVAKFTKLRGASASTLARKQAAGRASWARRQQAKGGQDVVETDNDGGAAPPC
jgi:hypothetical protein